MAQDAALESGVDAEIIDLRTIDPPGLDWATIEASVRKTNALLIVERNARGTSIGARIASDAQMRLFDWLDHEIIHVTGAEAAPVVSRVLERAALADVHDVVEALHTLDRRKAR